MTTTYESEIAIPPQELIDPNTLKFDGDNPNKMSDSQQNALDENIRRFGFIVPVITNRDLIVADGEHRAKRAIALGMKTIPVIRLDVDDVDRRLLRQVLNKLRGEHAHELDVLEFEKIIAADRAEDLSLLLDMSEKEIDKMMHPEPMEEAVRSVFEVIVECKDESDQETVFNQLVSEGRKCRLSTL
jgi:ParB-like chromosome segregation protein Spo0J